MTNEALKELIVKLAPEATFNENKQMVVAIIPSAQLFAVVKELKESAATKFDFLFSLTGVDFNPGLGVVYHLESTELKHVICLKTSTEDRVNPKLDSITSLYPAAELQEREVFDLFGVSFNNHPDNRRLFLDDEWIGYPLRKDYVDTVNIIDLIK